MFVVARYRAALSATDASARAWHDERDASIARAERLAADLVIERAETAALKARPDMEAVVALLESHESSAEKRTDRIIKAINGDFKAHLQTRQAKAGE